MYDKRRTGRNNRLVTHQVAQPQHQVNLSFTGSYPVFPIGDIHCHGFGTRIQDDNRIQPRIAVRTSLQAEGHHIIGRRMQEFQVCTDFLGISQTKSRMCLPQRNQPFHVIEHITMLVFSCQLMALMLSGLL